MANRTRRQFLEDSMFAAAAAAAAGSSMPLMAQEGQSKSPNEKLGVAVVGVRGRGGSHIGAFAGRKDTEVRYIVDPDENVGMSRVESVEKRQGRRPEFVEDLRKALDDDSVDIVSIATPNHWHALASIWAIQAGKDVYVEKPVSHNVSEGRRIVDAARKHKKIVQAGTQCRSNSGMIDAIKFVQEGGIGECKLARGLCYKRRGSIGKRGTYKPPESVNYDLWLGPAPMAPVTRPQFHYDWHWQWPYGNGDLGNQGIHQVDLARWGLNKDGLAHAVLSYGGRFGYEDAGETANTQVMIHDYGDKTLVFEVRGLNTGAYKGAKIGVIWEGEDGYVVVPNYSGGAAFDRDGKKIKEFSGGGDHFGNFLSAVRSRDRSELTGEIEEGHYSSALCHLGNISYLLGEEASLEESAAALKQAKSVQPLSETLERTVEHLRDNGVSLDEEKMTMGVELVLDPEKEDFSAEQTSATSDQVEKATAMLTREYREPFVVPSSAEKV